MNKNKVPPFKPRFQAVPKKYLEYLIKAEKDVKEGKCVRIMDEYIYINEKGN